MRRKKPSISNSPPVMGQREKELLAELDAIRLTKKKITVASFARDVGYANKSALRHFPVLRRELSRYISELSKPNSKYETSLATKYFKSQIERQALVIERLNRRVKTVPRLKAKIGKLEQKLKEDSRQKKLLRGMLTTVIGLLSGSDFAKARDLSARLEKQAKELINDDESTDD